MIPISENYKKGINIALAVLMFLFCVVFVYVLLKSEDEDELVGNENETNQGMVDYTDEIDEGQDRNQEDNADNSLNDDAPMEDVEEELGFEEQEIEEEQLAKDYEEFVDKEVVKETKKLAKDFFEIFYNLDGRYPLKYLEESKDFMTTDLYREIEGNPEVGSYEVFNRKVKKVTIEESKDFTAGDLENGIFYIAHVDGETVNANKENKQTTSDVFIINIINDEGEFKVNKIVKNLTYR